MRYALVGYGKMGRAVEAAASVRGHVCAAVIDTSAKKSTAARTIERARWRGIDVAFEFTTPRAARDNVLAIVSRGIRVVCGTTGWDADDAALRRAVRASKAAVIVAPNFSVGMLLFYDAVAQAARRFLAAGDYDPWIAEWHHRAKADAPSGTALRLAGLVGDAPIAAVRAGHEPGRHLVGFDGPHDAVTFEHAARGRGGFAAGAVSAAEWLQGRRGIHRFEDVVDDLLRGARPRGGKRGGKR